MKPSLIPGELGYAAQLQADADKLEAHLDAWRAVLMRPRGQLAILYSKSMHLGEWRGDTRGPNVINPRRRWWHSVSKLIGVSVLTNYGYSLKCGNFTQFIRRFGYVV